MENRPSNGESFGDNTYEPNKPQTGLTPRELIHYHMNNPDEPISDEAMENLVLVTNSSAITANTPEDTTNNALLTTND
ncbi:hypothetical protein FC093_16840 [Ilyomonas limi]|uniref:Uncharacterized protein n=1 Tax=Ilyomonas limi TaxID=2575867 RepID=A0A4U3KVY7_9BACT|nr:hypothetical protein [Ilyomonas limi]TKK66701.1 hypothetical protein FC093_16840 [Ilyomonas limi]